MINKHESFSALLKHMFSISEDTASHNEIRERLLSGGKISGTNMVIMICAILIASVGLNTDSIAVIIGAMLVSPLMGTILAIAYGTASANIEIPRKFGIGFAFQIIVSVATATLYFLISPEKTATAQILARTQPSFFDVIIASAGGIAGIIGQTRKDKANNIIPGVAIATALMPPLCTCGYSIANGQWAMLAGAFYLFMVNAYFIFFSADIVLTVLQIPKVQELTPEQWLVRKHKMVRNAIIMIIPTILLGYFVY